MELKKLLFSLVVGTSYLNITSYLGAQTNPINPTEAATSFNVFTSGDAIAVRTESEGSWAVGGDLTIDGTINIFGGINHFNGDAQPTALVVNGKVIYTSGRLQILENNYVKIGDLSTSSIFEVDQNNVTSNTRITAIGSNYDSTPSIALSTQQTAVSIAENPQINFNTAFNQFETISAFLSSQSTNVTWNENEISQGKLWLDLIPNETNVINLTIAEFNALSEIKFNALAPSDTTPLIINITDISNNEEIITIDSWPNIVGSPLSYAPYILYNFANITSTLNYVGGAQIYGTIYAPQARFNNRSNFNIDGQIIVEAFEQNSGEVHPYIFDATIIIPDTPTEEICDGIDNDNDGLIDEGFADTDGDGVADCIDNCIDTYNPNQTDVDENGIGDICETAVAEEICDGIDNDNDGLIDEGFADTDGDGVADCIDNCIDTYNPNQIDVDENGVGDICETAVAEEICDGIDNDNDGLIDEGFADTDGDGVADCMDNCIDTYNPNQTDVDENGIGDICETAEAEEICDGIDNDNDGLIDEGFADTDGDGVADCMDNCIDTYNPNQTDIDENGIGDICETPQLEDYCDGVDNDGDGLIDEGFYDTDGDGVADCIDNCLYTFNPDQADLDDNLIGDVCEYPDGSAGRSSNYLDVYPSPFKETINLKYNAAIGTTATIEIFDVTGNVLKRINNSIGKATTITTLDLSDTVTGHYVLFVRLTTNEGTIVKKIIKN